MMSMTAMTECPSFTDIEARWTRRCDRDAALSDAANEGCLETVKKLLEQVPLYDKCELINGSPIRYGEEDEDKWFSVTPLLAASKSGHHDVTGYLLMAGADPSLRCSPLPGVQETALSAARNSLKQMEKTFQNILCGSHYIYDRDAWTDTDVVLSRYFAKCRGLEKCIYLLEAAKRYWSESEYRDATWTEERDNVHKVGGKPNKPRQKEGLIEEITRILLSCETHLCPPSEELGELLRGEYNRLLLDKRCEMLELKINENKMRGLVTPIKKRNVVGVLASKRGRRGGKARVVKRFVAGK